LAYFLNTKEFKGFGMIQIRDVERLIGLCKKGEDRKRILELRDCATLFALIAKADWSTGQIPVTAEALADLTDVTPNEARQSLARLIGQNMVRRVVPKQGTGFFYAINPWMVEFGKEKARNILCDQFVEA
jgi:hypothetical protein